MHYFSRTTLAALLSASTCLAQTPQAPPLSKPQPKLGPSRGVVNAPVTPPNQLVEIELMTHPEIYDAIHKQGKTTVLVYTGGTEQRGPQCVLGGHTLMGREIAKTIALKLGNALVAPVLPFTPNNANPKLPGTIGLTPDLLAALLEQITDQLVKNEFKNIVLMGDHGGGQPTTYQQTAEKLDAKYSPQGVRVVYSDEVYAKANGDFDTWLAENGYPPSSHAGIPDTSEMLYLGGDAWVRRDKITFGDPIPPRRGQANATAPGSVVNAPAQPPERDPNAPPRIGNGITGDARPASPQLGKKLFDMKVEYAVTQITRLLAMPKTAQ